MSQSSQGHFTENFLKLPELLIVRSVISNHEAKIAKIWD